MEYGGLVSTEPPPRHICPFLISPKVFHCIISPIHQNVQTVITYIDTWAPGCTIILKRPQSQPPFSMADMFSQQATVLPILFTQSQSTYALLVGNLYSQLNSCTQLPDAHSFLIPSCHCCLLCIGVLFRATSVHI